MHLSNFKYCQLTTYAAGMQGACTQEVADKVIKQALRINTNTGNMIEWCLGVSMELYNKMDRSQFSDGLINYLKS